VPQRPFLPEYATVREAVKLIARDAADHDIERAVTRVGLMSELQAASPGAPLNAPVAALSAGQRQRLALARALAKDTAILLLDEPDANLDQAGIDLIADIVRSMGGKAIAIAAHTPQIIRLGDRVLRLGERRSGI
jgi:ABC-type transport system involved in cytochrome bd biosynthesis fused ATPase/permease subunit